MSLDEIKNEISKINSYLKNCLWMDFEICEMSFIKIEVAGRIDRSINDFLELIWRIVMRVFT